MKSINFETGYKTTENFVFKQRRATIKLRRQVRDLIHEWSDAEKKLSDQYLVKVENKEYNDKVIELGHKYYINIFKTILDDSQFNTDEKELISTAWNDDFWENQDIEAIELAVRQFRHSS